MLTTNIFLLSNDCHRKLSRSRHSQSGIHPRAIRGIVSVDLCRLRGHLRDAANDQKRIFVRQGRGSKDRLGVIGTSSPRTSGRIQDVDSVTRLWEFTAFVGDKTRILNQSCKERNTITCSSTYTVPPTATKSSLPSLAPTAPQALLLILTGLFASLVNCCVPGSKRQVLLRSIK